MATRHGKKIYYQLLLDPNRAKLLEGLAAEQGKRTTAAIRDMLYAYLQQVVPPSVYAEAVEKDSAVWNESVKNRIEGRR